MGLGDWRDQVIARATQRLGRRALRGRDKRLARAEAAGVHFRRDDRQALAPCPAAQCAQLLFGVDVPQRVRGVRHHDRDQRFPRERNTIKFSRLESQCEGHLARFL